MTDREFAELMMRHPDWPWIWPADPVACQNCEGTVNPYHPGKHDVERITALGDRKERYIVTVCRARG